VSEERRHAMFALKPVTRRALLPRTENLFGWPVEFETLFNRLFRLPVVETPEWNYPWGLTTEEKEKEVVVRAELPGFTPEELFVEITGMMLKVKAEHKPVEEKEKAEKAEVKAERTFEYEVTLPETVELEKVEATYRNGVLEVHFPRKPEAVGRRIEVKT